MQHLGQAIKKLHVMSKPIGAICNLDCRYCYYLSKQDLLDYNGENKLSEPLLERYIQQYIEAHNAPEILFTWQGGEPTLLGLDYFRSVVRLQQKYCPTGSVILNDFQTNGVLLNEQWCQFFKQHNFLVGISIDGPQKVHDHYRSNKAGRGSFHKVMAAIELLHHYQVPFATLTCVNDRSPELALDIYRFLRDEVRSPQIQFIPIVEHSTFRDSSPYQAQIDVEVQGANTASLVEPWSVTAKGWGSFLCHIFDEWLSRDVGTVHVVYFEAMLQAWLGMISPLCTHAPLCGKGLAMEPNGDVYSCDHYVYPDFKLGNIEHSNLAEMAFSSRQEKFGRSKSTDLTAQCKQCDYLFACYGECPKNRIVRDNNGQTGHNYLCQGWYEFYRHIEQPLVQLIKKLGYTVKKGAMRPIHRR